MNYFGIIFCGILLFTAINAFAKKKKPFKRAFVSMLLGVIALITVNIVGLFCDVGVTISPFSLTAAACGGVPAVAAMVLIGTLM